MLAAAGAVVAQITSDPMEQRRGLLQRELAAVQAGEEGLPSFTSALPYDDWRQEINGRSDLWRSIVEVRRAPPRPPNWAELLKGIRTSRAVVGSPPTQVKVFLTPNDQVGRWVEEGEYIGRGARVVDIHDDGTLVLEKRQSGQSYRHNLRPPR
jgi:hypothetical protein